MNVSEIRITVIIPTYKRKSLLKRCVEQILAQISETDEIIVCNDDRSDILSLEFFDWDSNNIQIVENKGQRGPSGNRNTGAQLAKNDFLLFMDDDDFMRPGYIKSLKSTLAQYPNADYGGSNIQVFVSDDELKDLPTLQPELAAPAKRAEERLIGAGCGLWFKRALFLELGMFDTDLKNSEDNDLCMRAISFRANCFKFIQPWVLVNRVEHNEMESVTRNTQLNEKIFCWRRVYQKSTHFLPFYSKVRIVLLERFIRRSVRLGHQSAALKHIFMHPRDPLNFVALIYLILMNIQTLSNHTKYKPKQKI